LQLKIKTRCWLLLKNCLTLFWLFRIWKEKQVIG
jgi:hypothetical protein